MPQPFLNRTLLIGFLALGTIVCEAQTNRQELSPEVRALLETMTSPPAPNVQNYPAQTKPPEPSPEVKALLETMNIWRRPNFENYHAMTDEARELLIAHFREQRRFAEGPRTPDSEDLGTTQSRIREANRALTLLSDPDMTDALLRTFSETPITHLSREPRELLFLVTDPKAIQRLEPEIQKDEPIDYAAQSVARIPKPYIAAAMMMRIVANSPEFEADTRKWAAANQSLTPEERIVVLRQWWKENGALIKAGNYKAVKPGENRIAVHWEKTRKLQEWAAARDAKVTAEEAAQKAAASASGVPATVATAEPGWGTLGYVLVAFIALLVMAAGFLYGRSARHA